MILFCIIALYYIPKITEEKKSIKSIINLGYQFKSKLGISS